MENKQTIYEQRQKQITMYEFIKHNPDGTGSARECPTMEKPLEHPFTDHTGDRESADRLKDKWDRYDRHIASLKIYPVSESLAKTLKEGQRFEAEIRYEAQAIQLNVPGLVWIEIRKETYDKNELSGNRREILIAMQRQ